VVYISPLKTLAYDVERNLRAAGASERRSALALRTGDTPAREREAMRRAPPDTLITTPESLYLLLTSRAQAMLTGVEDRRRGPRGSRHQPRSCSRA
jgi:ATP-dependent Lhr-like helicase